MICSFEFVRFSFPMALHARVLALWKKNPSGPRPVGKAKARFKRRNLHVQKLIIRFGTCNESIKFDRFAFGSTLPFYSTCPDEKERQKYDFDSDVELYMCRP